MQKQSQPNLTYCLQLNCKIFKLFVLNPLKTQWRKYFYCFSIAQQNLTLLRTVCIYSYYDQCLCQLYVAFHRSDKDKYNPHFYFIFKKKIFFWRGEFFLGGLRYFPQYSFLKIFPGPTLSFTVKENHIGVQWLSRSYVTDKKAYYFIFED